ncbi:MAG: hypothetical protein IT377_03800 [Polyangiaceae bacterium]|nr:hypothetical protein [Myxococcales bacterium]MCC6898071.1 hypothetical protein [Polyangiaceae bacterium]
MSRDLSLKQLYKRAVFNQYNMILLGGAGLFAATTMSVIPLIVGGGIELLWLVLGADTSFFKRWVLNQVEKEKAEALERETAGVLAKLHPNYVQCFRELQDLAATIEKLVLENPTIKNDLIKDEMKKLGQLLFTYVRMAVLHQRLAQYLTEERAAYIESAIANAKRELARETRKEVRNSLEQNLELANKRMAQHQAIDASYRTLSVRMDTLENSFRYLKSHVVGVGGHDELRQQIDGLVEGVDFVEELTNETDSVLDAIEADAEMKSALRASP